ncbi:hypothetical protein G6O67_001392 [Ophiocordyceps sinensis]|uniref:Uncharacterized protein n=1 Tax=Ophiocordyceps sinensis TaxID=72228 RepID=A0A8H4V8U9_9HYPO|nr:hypothetical protein G6O67_001392 [Ophiocordyceps sinensis]
MARRGRKPRSAMLAGVILLSETASGTKETLSSVGPISSAPFACKVAYNALIWGCSVNDSPTKPCSQLCLRNIDRIQPVIQKKCGGATASENSLLSQAQKGRLSSVLCGTGSSPESSVIVTTSRSISATLSFATPTFSSTPSVTGTMAPTLLPPSITPTTSISRTTPTTSISGTTPTTSIVAMPTSIVAMPTSIVALPTSSRASLASTANPRSPQPPADPKTSTSSEAQIPTPPPRSGGGIGGGSPFDFITGVSPASKNQSPVLGIVAGWALAALLVQ